MLRFIMLKYSLKHSERKKREFDPFKHGKSVSGIAEM